MFEFLKQRSPLVKGNRTGTPGEEGGQLEKNAPLLPAGDAGGVQGQVNMVEMDE